jgi:hypothetical protein
MAKHGYARCQLGPSWKFLALSWTCPRAVPVAQDVAAKRAEWDAKRMGKILE